MKSIFTVLAIVLGTLGTLRSQDIHFTLYDMMPLVFNPAETGAFYGTYRISGLYRDQHFSVTGFGNSFKTPSFSVDLPVIKGFRDNDWVGVGVMFYSDKAGSLGLQHSAFKLSAAYHFALDKKGKSILTLGYQTGSVQKRLKDGLISSDPNAVVLLDEMDPLLTGGTGDGGLEASFTDHVGGLHLRSYMDDANTLKLGASVAHIGNPRGSLGQGSGFYKVPMRFLAKASWRSRRSDRFAIEPSVFFQSYGPATEIVAQFVGEYLYNPEKHVVLRGGLGYRVGDALQVILGVDIKDLKVNFGYDINMSRLTSASNSIGGFEIAAMFVGKIYKKPDPDPVLFCPRF